MQQLNYNTKNIIDLEKKKHHEKASSVNFFIDFYVTF